MKDDPSNGLTGKVFKVSNGWLSNFVKRRKLKYRKRKSGKKVSANVHLQKYLVFLEKLRFDYLGPKDWDTTAHPLWGRFLPEHRYNMDQVPLPFVVNHDFTYTVEDDKDIHTSAPSDLLRKRQFTMHVVVNAGEGPKRQGFVDLVDKGNGTRIMKAEKEQWDERVDVFWQRNAWVDAVVMRKLARKFVDFKVRVHGESTWVLLFCDNLSAHLDEEVKEIFGSGLDLSICLLLFSFRIDLLHWGGSLCLCLAFGVMIGPGWIFMILGYNRIA